MREAVEASFRPRVSEVYGVHVPLGERAARLQCLAVLSLVAVGEDESGVGGGSGSGGELRCADRVAFGWRRRVVGFGVLTCPY